MNRSLVLLFGLLVGAAVAWFLLRGRAVPPPPFTGASFANNAPPRTVKSANVYTWKVPGKVPAEANRKDPAKWDAADYVMKALDPLSGSYYGTKGAFGLENVVTTALVVVVMNDGKEETYINFAPDAPLTTTYGVSHVNAWLAPDTNPTLTVAFFKGNTTAPDERVEDATSYTIK